MKVSARIFVAGHRGLVGSAVLRRLGVRPVSTISEAMALLEHLDDVRRQPGLMRSIKRAIGAAD